MVRLFKPQFAPLVEAGTKKQTVRPVPKRMPKPGDKISLRTWTGNPYRSKQRILRESVIVGVHRCLITEQAVTVDAVEQMVEEFAKADGFQSFTEMTAWFSAKNPLPFGGILIRWE